jgi:drug/metabolite transporter (DMT)-like permease
MNKAGFATGGVLALIRNPYFLLSFAVLLWGGNFVVGRLANLDVPPMALSFWRHVLAALIVLPFAYSAIRRDKAVIRAHSGTFVLMSLLFVAGNTLVYVAILQTTVINAALINAGVPVVVAFFSWVILRDVVNRWQRLGIVLCFSGIAVVVARAQVSALTGLQLGAGDLFMFLAIVSWALYMVLLKRMGLKISPWTLLFVLSAGGAVWLVPIYAVELYQGQAMEWTMLTAISLIYVALFSTIIAWACWNSGTLSIGPNRASVFMCLHPVFGSVLGMVFFDEVLRSYHAVGILLVLLGVWLVARVWSK